VRHLTLWWRGLEPAELGTLTAWGDIEPLANPYGPVIGRDARILLSGGNGRIVMLTLNEACGR